LSEDRFEWGKGIKKREPTDLKTFVLAKKGGEGGVERRRGHAEGKCLVHIKDNRIKNEFTRYFSMNWMG
jgi:hypothetical protein